jgi:signal transduction histidine kinase
MPLVGPTRILLIAFLAELPFVVLGPYACLRGLRLPVAGEPLAWVVVLQAVKYLAIFPPLAIALSRWSRSTQTEDALRRARARGVQLPLRFALAWALLWGVFFATLPTALRARGLVAVGDANHLTAAAVFMGIAGFLAAFTLLFPLLNALTFPRLAELTLEAQRRGMRDSHPAPSLRRLMAMFAFALAIAPSCWMTALICLDATDSVTLGTFFFTAALWAVLSAYALSLTWADPVRRMQKVMAEIVRRGAVSEELDRIPVVRGDELGRLAEGLNQMLDRLARSAAELSARMGDAERALQIRDEFLTVAAHELRTPLTALSLQLDTLERGLDASPPPALERARRQVRQLRGLISDLLDVSRIQSGRMEIRAEPMDLAALVRDVADTFGKVSVKHAIVAELPGQAVWVVGDHSRLEQVLTNLIDNAIKYSPEGGAVRLALVSHGDEVVVSIVDQGIGIDAKEQPQLFQRYFRGVDATRRKMRGVGLGLFICHSIVEQHAGRIWVESIPSQGSRFHVALPLAAPARVAVGVSARAATR